MTKEQEIQDLVKRLIREAVQEERERCALTAEAWAWGRKCDGSPDGYLYGMWAGEQFAAKELARLIRNSELVTNQELANAAEIQRHRETWPPWCKQLHVGSCNCPQPMHSQLCPSHSGLACNCGFKG